MSTSWYTYIVRCADGTLYCGVAKDLDARIATHNAGKGARYTRSRRPVVLVYRKRCRDQSTALRQEITIKRLTRDEKLQLIRRARPALAARGIRALCSLGVHAVRAHDGNEERGVAGISRVEYRPWRALRA
jgi:putative endonuclease